MNRGRELRNNEFDVAFTMDASGEYIDTPPPESDAAVAAQVAAAAAAAPLIASGPSVCQDAKARGPEMTKETVARLVEVCGKKPVEGGDDEDKKDRKKRSNRAKGVDGADNDGSSDDREDEEDEEEEEEESDDDGEQQTPSRKPKPKSKHVDPSPTSKPALPKGAVELKNQPCDMAFAVTESSTFVPCDSAQVVGDNHVFLPQPVLPQAPAAAASSKSAKDGDNSDNSDGDEDEKKADARPKSSPGEYIASEHHPGAGQLPALPAGTQRSIVNQQVDMAFEVEASVVLTPKGGD